MWIELQRLVLSLVLMKSPGVLRGFLLSDDVRGLKCVVERLRWTELVQSRAKDIFSFYL